MELVSKEVMKLSEELQRAQRELENTSLGEAWVQETVDLIFNYHIEGMEGTLEDVVDPDSLPFEIKRIAIERSGIIVTVYPKGCVIGGELNERTYTAITYGVKPPTIAMSQSFPTQPRPFSPSDGTAQQRAAPAISSPSMARNHREGSKSARCTPHASHSSYGDCEWPQWSWNASSSAV